MKLVYLLNRYYCIDAGSRGNDLVSKMDLEGSKELTIQPNLGNNKGREDANGANDSNPLSPEKYPSEHRNQENVEMDLDDPLPFASSHQIEKLKKRFVKRTKGYGVSDLEKLHATICQEVRSHGDIENKMSAFQVLEQTVAGMKVKKNSVSQEGMAL